MSFGLLTNSVTPLTDEPIRVMPNRTRQQLTTVLESLAVVTPLGRQSMGRFLMEQTRRMPTGSTIVLVTSVLDDETIDALRALRRAGARPSVVWTAETPSPTISDPDIIVHEIGHRMAQLEHEAIFRPGVDRRTEYEMPTDAVKA